MAGQAHHGVRPVVRVDDLRAGGTSVTLGGELLAVLEAQDASEVTGVLSEVERHAAAGACVGGYVAYEAATGLDPGLATLAPVPRLPLAWFAVFGERIVVPRLEPPGDPGRASLDGPPSRDSSWKLDTSEAEHLRAVERIKQRIADGYTYQCNYTSRFRHDALSDPFEHYRRLALAQRGGYSAYLDTGSHVIASASPELFFEWTDDSIVTRPMKGTARRGRTEAEDALIADALVRSSKDRAENLMIIDLVRNDLGRLAPFGTVRVPALFELERYETVWQLTSTIESELRGDVGLVDIFRALFPSGSVTGAPKHETMRLITELERTPRGVYCGAIGMVGGMGAVRGRFSVAIRTAVLDRATGSVTYGAGGGITWGSDGPSEFAELRAKAAILNHPVEDFSLVETMALGAGGVIRHRQLHLDRMASSARYFGFAVDLADVEAALARCVDGCAGPARLRLLVSRDGAVTVESGPMPESAAEVELALAEVPIDSSDPWLLHKTTRRAVYDVRRAAAPHGVDDVILVNERDQLTETSIANLLVCLDGLWCTPSVESGCLPGIGRAALLAAGGAVERELSVADLARAEGLAVVSSLRGVRAARLVARAGRKTAAGGEE